MLIRIVKMEFKPELVPQFLELFHRAAPLIRNFNGCSNLELYRDQNHPHILFTYSYWQGPEFLEQYRQSELFQTTWADTKVLFGGRPQAWSVERIWGN